MCQPEGSRRFDRTWSRLIPFGDRLAEELGFAAPYGGLVNRDVALPFHRDRTNPGRSWNVTVVFRYHADGGLLVFPDLRRAFECPDSSVIVFDGQKHVHGVSPIELGVSGYRVSISFYCATLGDS